MADVLLNGKNGNGKKGKNGNGKNGNGENGAVKYQVSLIGLDVFDPVTMEVIHRAGAQRLPAWFLDTDYNGRCFHVCQAFFPRTGAWESLKKCAEGNARSKVCGTTWPERPAPPSRPARTQDFGEGDRRPRNELQVLDSGEKGATFELVYLCMISASAQDDCDGPHGVIPRPHLPMRSEGRHATWGIPVPKYRSKTCSTGVPWATSSQAARKTSR